MNKDQDTKCHAPIDRLLEHADNFARNDPTRAALTAFGAGVALNLLPLGAIAATAVDVAFSLVRPALLSLGLVRALELLRHKTQTQ